MSPADDQPTIEQVLTALMKECNKENLKYKSAALNYTTDVLEAYSIDKYKDISDIIYPMLEKVNHFVVKYFQPNTDTAWNSMHTHAHTR